MMSQREYMAIVNRQRRLPEQLERARARVRQLEAEALRLGRRDILESESAANRAWDREVELARMEGERRA